MQSEKDWRSQGGDRTECTQTSLDGSVQNDSGGEDEEEITGEYKMMQPKANNEMTKAKTEGT